MMRSVYIGLVVLTMSLTLPVSVAIVVVYFLGMVSGGALIASVRSLVQRARAS